MPPFSKEDFTPDNATRLTVIIMPKMGKAPLTGYKSLPETQQKKFNRLLNEYISTLGENWNEKLLNDFNTIVNEDILNEDFDPNRQSVPILNTGREVLMNEEQKEFFKDKPEELEKFIGKA
jgi:hypothetical protein